MRYTYVPVLKNGSIWDKAKSVLIHGICWFHIVLKIDVISCHTPLKVNIGAKNQGLEDDFSFKKVIFRFYVKFPGCRFSDLIKQMWRKEEFLQNHHFFWSTLFGA